MLDFDIPARRCGVERIAYRVIRARRSGLGFADFAGRESIQQIALGNGFGCHAYACTASVAEQCDRNGFAVGNRVLRNTDG